MSGRQFLRSDSSGKLGLIAQNRTYRKLFLESALFFLKMVIIRMLESLDKAALGRLGEFATKEAVRGIIKEAISVARALGSHTTLQD